MKVNRGYSKIKVGLKVKICRCPFHYRCACTAEIIIIMGQHMMQLDRRGEHNVKTVMTLIKANYWNTNRLSQWVAQPRSHRICPLQRSTAIFNDKTTLDAKSTNIWFTAFNVRWKWTESAWLESFYQAMQSTNHSVWSLIFVASRL